MRQRDTTVTISTADLKRAFRGAFPHQSAAELKQPWERLWASVVLHGEVARSAKPLTEKPTVAEPTTAEEPTVEEPTEE